MLFKVTIQGHHLPDYVVELRGDVSTMAELQALHLFYNKHPGVKVTKISTIKEKAC
jgi:hypothetical protein